MGLELFRPSLLRNQRGQSLIQVMVAAGVGAIVMLAFASTQANQARENRALAEKLGALEVFRVASLNLTTATVCISAFAATNLVSGNINDLNFNGSTVSATTPFLINLKSLAGYSVGTQPSELSNSLNVLPATGIQIQVTTPPAGGQTTGNLLINFDQTKLVRTIHNLSFTVTITVSGSAPTNTVTGCNPAATPATAFVPGTNGIALFTTTGIWAVPAGVTQVKVTAVGGGGGSEGSCGLGATAGGTSSLQGCALAAGGGGGGLWTSPTSTGGTASGGNLLNLTGGSGNTGTAGVASLLNLNVGGITHGQGATTPGGPCSGGTKGGGGATSVGICTVSSGANLTVNIGAAGTGKVSGYGGVVLLEW